MSRKYWIILASLGLAVLLVSVFLFMKPLVTSAAPKSQPLEQAPTQLGTYVWNFSVKFVCGLQPKASAASVGEPLVKPGNYATEINIHNYNYRPDIIRQKFLVFANGTTEIQEPVPALPTPFLSFDMPPDGGLMVSCNRIFQFLNPNVPVIPTPLPLMIGYLVVLSPLDLDVQAVYTASTPGVITQDATGISEEVVIVPGKRVFLPSVPGQ
jgi:hypothetical protein